MSILTSDKILHAETCALITIIASLFLPVWAGALIAIALGVGKEIWDKHHGGVPSWLDLLADIAGTCIGSLVAWLNIALFV